jgi:hypothetical protein
MLIPRYITQEIIKKLEPGKVAVIYGPRRVGKTILIKEILKELNEPNMFISGEDRDVRTWLSGESISTFKRYLGDTKLLVIDEAQKIDHIGLNLKIIVDSMPDIRIIATGSSSFELAHQVGEPLVGRKWQYTLFPIAQLELQKTEARHETEANLSERLIFGSYPEIVTAGDIEKKREILDGIVDNYLYSDLMTFDEIKKSQKIINVLKHIAFQIGQEVSLQEVANAVDLNVRTVEKYLDLLEKVFVIKRVYGFSRNLRKEITKTSRFYFYDNGVRNAIIRNFNDLETRDDVGQLWENYVFMERMKKQAYQHIFANNYFWRTYSQNEIDLVEEREGKLFGYEIKWGKKEPKAPVEWLETYKNAEYKVINRDNYLDFIG